MTTYVTSYLYGTLDYENRYPTNVCYSGTGTTTCPGITGTKYTVTNPTGLNAMSTINGIASCTSTSECFYSSYGSSSRDAYLF